MTALATGVPYVTDAAVIEVENALKPGRHRFRLTVLDGAKNESDPAFIVVTVSEVKREPRVDPRIETWIERAEPRIDPRILTRRETDRIVLDPGGGGVARPTRPTILRRPGG